RRDSLIMRRLLRFHILGRLYDPVGERQWVGRQVGGVLAVGGGPYANLAAPIAGDDPAAVVAECGPQRDVGKWFKRFLLSAVAVPNLGHEVAAAGDDAAVFAELRRLHAAAVS